MPWRLRGREGIFKSGLKERVKVEQEESVWEEVVMLQVEARLRIGTELEWERCWVVHMNQDMPGLELVGKAAEG